MHSENRIGKGFFEIEIKEKNLKVDRNLEVLIWRRSSNFSQYSNHSYTQATGSVKYAFGAVNRPLSAGTANGAS